MLYVFNFLSSVFLLRLVSSKYPQTNKMKNYISKNIFPISTTSRMLVIQQFEFVLNWLKMH